MRILPFAALPLAIVSLIAPACSSSSSETTPTGAAGQAGADGGSEAAADSGADALQEAAPEAALDAVVDVQPEAGTSWSTQLVDDAPNFKSRVALATAADGTPHIAYNIATSSDGWSTPSVWYATWKNDAWQRQIAVDAAGVSAEFPSIVVDAAGIPYVFFNRNVTAEQQIEVFMVVGDGKGGFGAPINLTNTKDKDEYAASVAIDASGAIHVLMQQSAPDPGDPNSKVYSIGYVRVQGGQPGPAESVTSASSQFALNPDYGVAVEPDGTVHAVYCKPGDQQLNNVVYYRARSAGAWGSETALTEVSLDAWGPIVGVDAAKTVHVAYTQGPDWDTKALHYNRIVGGVPAGEQKLSASIQDRTYYLGMAVESSGKVHIGFARLFDSGNVSNGDIFHLQGKDGTFEAEQRLTDTPEGDETAPSIALGVGGAPLIAFVENMLTAPNGKVYLARWQ